MEEMNRKKNTQRLTTGSGSFLPALLPEYVKEKKI